MSKIQNRASCNEGIHQGGESRKIVKKKLTFIIRRRRGGRNERGGGGGLCPVLRRFRDQPRRLFM